MKLVQAFVAATNCYARQHGLSAREGELVTLRVHNLRDKQAGEEMRLARGTLARLWHRIFAKTGAREQGDVVDSVHRLAVE